MSARWPSIRSGRTINTTRKIGSEKEGGRASKTTVIDKLKTLLNWYVRRGYIRSDRALFRRLNPVRHPDCTKPPI